MGHGLLIALRETTQMVYKPQGDTATILQLAMGHVNSVPYAVTARWVFYRLLQDGVLDKKSDYKKLLGYLSKARKGFAEDWRPDTLADDTREAVVRGTGFSSGTSWLSALTEQVECNLDRWTEQEYYLEIWFEAAAMQAQFTFHTNGNIPLLAFHGDISIPEKWQAAKRLVDRWYALGQKPVVVLYYGDLDPKGLQIPESAKDDILQFIVHVFVERAYGLNPSSTVDVQGIQDAVRPDLRKFQAEFQFIRIGLNEDHPDLYGIPENPERPGTYQWEGLDDDSARELIAAAEEYLDQDGFDQIEHKETDISNQVRTHLGDLEIQE